MQLINADEHVFEPGKGIDMNALARGHETAQHRGCPSADITPEKNPVTTTDCTPRWCARCDYCRSPDSHFPGSGSAPSSF